MPSTRGEAWRLSDSLALRRFVWIGLTEQTPDHSTISRTRRLIDVEAHRAVFGGVLGLFADRGLIRGHLNVLKRLLNMRLVGQEP